MKSRNMNALTAIALAAAPSGPIGLTCYPDDISRIAKKQKNNGKRRIGKVGYKQADLGRPKGSERNKRCTCASGKKFKHCCWDNPRDSK